MGINEVLYLSLMIVGILVFFYAVYYFTKFIAKTNRSFFEGNNIKVIERVPIGTNKFLAIVELDKKHYFLSISKDDVNLLDIRDNLIIKKSKKESFETVLLKKLKIKK